ncbi:MAG: GNAT family N-acetyltransferase [Bacillota bacterium]
MNTVLGPACKRDIGAVADIFLEAFQDSVRSILGGSMPRTDAVSDLFSFVLECEPRSFLVSKSDGEVTGYCIALSSLRALWLKTLFSGVWLRWLVRWAGGRYTISLGNMLRVVRNKIPFVLSPYNYRATDAQILSIAVKRGHRGRGLGRMLLQCALDSLKTRGVKNVKLEVRPDNEAAVRLYTQMGFVESGRTRDAAGPWTVMTLDLCT